MQRLVSYVLCCLGFQVGLAAQAVVQPVNADGTTAVFTPVAGGGAGPAAAGEYTLYGTGCKGSGGFNYCVGVNENATTNTTTTWAGNAWFAHKVIAPRPLILTGFEFFMHVNGNPVVVPCRVYDNTGANGAPGNILRDNLTMNVGSTSDWYRTTWTTPLIVQPNTVLFIAYQQVADLKTEITSGQLTCYWWFGTWNQEWCHRIFAHRVICVGGGSAIPRLGNTGLPEINKSFSVDLAMARASSGAALILGGSDKLWGAIPLPFKLDALGYTGCSLLASVDVLIATATSAQGLASINFSIPNDANLQGVRFYNQFLVVDLGAAGGIAFSNGGAAKIGP